MVQARRRKPISSGTGHAKGGRSGTEGGHNHRASEGGSDGKQPKRSDEARERRRDRSNAKRRGTSSDATVSTDSREFKVGSMATTNTNVIQPRSGNGSESRTSTIGYDERSRKAHISALCSASQRDSESERTEYGDTTGNFPRDNASDFVNSTASIRANATDTRKDEKHSTIIEHANGSLNLIHHSNLTCASLVYKNRRFLFNPILDIPIVGEYGTDEHPPLWIATDPTLAIYVFTELVEDIPKEVAENVAFLIDNLANEDWRKLTIKAQEIAKNLLLRITVVTADSIA